MVYWEKHLLLLTIYPNNYPTPYISCKQYYSRWRIHGYAIVMYLTRRRWRYTSSCQKIRLIVKKKIGVFFKLSRILQIHNRQSHLSCTVNIDSLKNRRNLFSSSANAPAHFAKACAAYLITTRLLEYPPYSFHTLLLTTALFFIWRLRWKMAVFQR